MTKATHFSGIDLHKTVVQVCVLAARGEVGEEVRVRLGTGRMARKCCAA